MKFKTLVKDLRSYNISMNDADHAADWLEALAEALAVFKQYEALGSTGNASWLIKREMVGRRRTKALDRLADLEATPAIPGGPNATITGGNT